MLVSLTRTTQNCIEIWFVSKHCTVQDNDKYIETEIEIATKSHIMIDLFKRNINIPKAFNLTSIENQHDFLKKNILTSSLVNMHKYH